jgi:hypothetical protein
VGLALEQLVTVPQAAKQMGKSRRAFLRSVLALHALDEVEGVPTDWLVVRHVRQRRVIRLNMSRLRAAHPGYIARHADDPQNYAERFAENERILRGLRQSQKALAAEVRELKKRLA